MTPGTLCRCKSEETNFYDEILIFIEYDKECPELLVFLFCKNTDIMCWLYEKDVEVLCEV